MCSLGPFALHVLSSCFSNARTANTPPKGQGTTEHKQWGRLALGNQMHNKHGKDEQGFLSHALVHALMRCI